MPRVIDGNYTVMLQAGKSTRRQRRGQCSILKTAQFRSMRSRLNSMNGAGCQMQLLGCPCGQQPFAGCAIFRVARPDNLRGLRVDISAYAGQTGQLQLRRLPRSGGNGINWTTSVFPPRRSRRSQTRWRSSSWRAGAGRAPPAQNVSEYSRP